MTPIVGYMPDSDPNTPGILIDCTNIIPFQSGFKGAPSPITTASNALSIACVGATVAVKLDGTRRIFAGTTTDLYELASGVWTSRTRAAPYTGGSDTRWSYCQFGDTTVASNLADVMQSSASGVFADIATAPKAKIVVSATNNFVVAFNTVDATYGTSPDRWWCCAQADQTNWTPNISTLATTGRLVAVEGAIQAALTLGDYVVAYKNRAIFIGVFVGSPVVWQWALVPGGEAGCVGQESVCDIGGQHFFVGNDNFWLFDGTRPTPIGDGKIRQWFLSNSSPQYRYKTKCSFDRQNNLVRVFFCSSASTGQIDYCLVYHVGKQQWGRADVAMEAPLNYIAPGVTINGMDAYATTIDALPNIPVDSQFWLSGGQTPAYFNTSHQLVALNGATGLSGFTTSDVGDDDAVTTINRVRVRYTSSPMTATATGFYKFNEGDALQAGAVNAINDGKFDVRQSARFHRVRIDMTGDHKETGYDIAMQPDGMR